jgi:hypothetical protein
MVFAFWNVNNNTDLAENLIDFVREQSIDVLLLAESDPNPKNTSKYLVGDLILDFLTKININIPARRFSLIPDGDFRVKVLTSLDPSFFSRASKESKGSRWSSIQINIPSVIQLNLFPVHFYSKVNWSNESLSLECANFARDINFVETNSACINSILIGDFNMNPFEHGMIASNGLHALQDCKYLGDKSVGREIDGTYYRYFYNPMWNFFGDHKTPYGTMYHRATQHVSYEWNTFDQVLIRPVLKKHLNNNSCRIITQIGGKSLLKKYNRPSKKFSDHLPIVLDLII